MSRIHVLDKKTIDQISAGEVVERPMSVIKELVENSIDAKATKITVEIKNGGIDSIRVTDNGMGIDKNEIQTAFLPHATSKISGLEDLFHIESLGFRGEALSSIASVANVEVITKTRDSLMGVSYEISGGTEENLQDMGAPDGTTIFVKNLFYNTPARRKFLKTGMTEGSYIADLIEKIALSHPEISFRLISNGAQKVGTRGKDSLVELVYELFGKEIAGNLLPVEYEKNGIRITGVIGKPVIAKGNRGFENYFINQRYIKSKVIHKAIEEAYQPFMMQHRYPFTVLYIQMEPEEFDVNVHPTKMEIRFQKGPMVFEAVKNAIQEALADKELIRNVSLEQEKKEKPEPAFLYHPAEPFETQRAPEKEAYERPMIPPIIKETPEYPRKAETYGDSMKSRISSEEGPKEVIKEQQQLFEDRFLSEENRKKHRLIGQLFSTYWLIESNDKLYILDQHAAHEKVLYERKVKELSEKTVSSQMISPPVLMTLSEREYVLFLKYKSFFESFGFLIEPFGDKEVMISQIPFDLYNVDVKELMTEIMGNLDEDTLLKKPDLVLQKIASISCKAAVKGNQKLSFSEADHLISELLTLENPYACPHGRPTLISITKTELEKKFKRIV